MSGRDLNMPLSIDEIEIPAGRRPVDPAAVKRLADSIDEIGLKHPITVRRKRGEEGKYVLVAGLHRLEACRKLGREHVPAIITTMTNAEARMWEIAENLHRAELTKLERSEQIEEWRKLAAEQGRQIASPQPAERGVKKAAEALGVDPAEVRRAGKIAGITDEAKAAAKLAGIDNNQSKLLKVAAALPEEQVSAVVDVARKKDRRAVIPNMTIEERLPDGRIKSRRPTAADVDQLREAAREELCLTPADRIQRLIGRAVQAVDLAQYDDLAGLEADEKAWRTALKAAEAWTKVASELAPKWIGGSRP